MTENNGWIPVKLGTDIHAPQTINPAYLGDPLIFLELQQHLKVVFT